VVNGGSQGAKHAEVSISTLHWLLAKARPDALSHCIDEIGWQRLLPTKLWLLGNAAGIVVLARGRALQACTSEECVLEENRQVPPACQEQQCIRSHEFHNPATGIWTSLQLSGQPWLLRSRSFFSSAVMASVGHTVLVRSTCGGRNRASRPQIAG
jgi:hypothetical protein